MAFYLRLLDVSYYIHFKEGLTSVILSMLYDPGPTDCINFLELIYSVTKLL